jgi:hypothetical protein
MPKRLAALWLWRDFGLVKEKPANIVTVSVPEISLGAGLDPRSGTLYLRAGESGAFFRHGTPRRTDLLHYQ